MPFLCSRPFFSFYSLCCCFSEMTKELFCLFSLCRFVVAHFVLHFLNLFVFCHHKWLIFLMNPFSLTNLLRRLFLSEFVSMLLMIFCVSHFFESVFSGFGEGFEHITIYESMGICSCLFVKIVTVVL